ncbi:hypothetical protein NMY22_g6710 [Coprinellus aureogranulatus]|nr:hypothetical protein NMY22_g6710 [Coprinellus aureogranulatus]
MASPGHVFGYSKSTRAKCHGPPPCKNSSMRPGTLRYGRTTTDVTTGTETVEWRHWGCVTQDILRQLALIRLDTIPSFQELNATDQQKIRIAVSLSRIDPSDVPETAKVKTAARPAVVRHAVPSTSTAMKRKATGTADPMALIPPPLTQGTRRAMIAEEEEDAAAPVEDIQDELYGQMTSEVVGIRHYRGLVGPGEEVLLIREPTNAYDRNAIQVKNISRVQVGHIPRTVAAKLAPLMDQQLITVEGVINDGNLSGSVGYTISITLKFYGHPHNRLTVLPKLPTSTRKAPPNRPQPTRTTSSSTPIIGGRTGPAYASTSQRGPGSAYGSSASYGNASYSPAQAGPASRPTQGTSHSAAQLEKIRQQQEALAKAAELQEMLNTLEKVNDEGRRESLLDTICTKDDILNLPVHADPPGTAKGNLKVDLLKHQLQALQWCIDKENPVLPTKESDAPVQFWQFKKNPVTGKSFYFNLATKSPQEATPVLGKGALVGDAMGLGKTLTMIALVLATQRDNTPNKFSKTTLIVAPVSILSNWEKQIMDHVAPGHLSTYLYYGNNRNISATDLQKYDVVITTYQTITGEHGASAQGSAGTKKKKVEGVLMNIPWKRVILDEGHVIRNPKTKMAQAVVALNADKRWILSGTPIINSPRDLGSMLTFLKICRPLDNEDFFKRLLLRPLKNGEPSGAELLRALMSHICIRRTKEMQDANGVPLIPLPPVEMIRVPVTLTEEVRSLYDQIESISANRFERILNSSNSTIFQSNVLSMLTRLRQLVLHPGLLPANYLDELNAAEAASAETDKPAKPLTPDEKFKLQDALLQAIEDCEECPICFNLLQDDSRITSCAHKFCVACIMEVINRDARCPMDRRTLTVGDLIEKPPPLELTQAPRAREATPETYGGSSAKIDQLIQLLKLIPADEKCLVFSQFTSFLDKVVEAFDAEGISFVRFDGKMSARRRQEAIEKFSVPIQKAREPEPPLPRCPDLHIRTRNEQMISELTDEISNQQYAHQKINSNLRTTLRPGNAEQESDGSHQQFYSKVMSQKAELVEQRAGLEALRVELEEQRKELLELRMSSRVAMEMRESALTQQRHCEDVSTRFSSDCSATANLLNRGVE